MGAAFAIQVMTGKESNVKRLMEWAFSKNVNAQKWIKAIHTFSQTTQRVLQSGELGKPVSRASMPGYIFLEMHYAVGEDNTSAYIADDVWHLIKSIPGVLKQFTRSGQIISEEEFEQMLGLDVTDQIEVSTPLGEDTLQEEAKTLAKAEVNVKLALHQANTAEHPQERNEAEQILEHMIQQEEAIVQGGQKLDTITAELESLDEQQKSHPIIRTIKSMVRSNKEIVRLPRTTLKCIGVSDDDILYAHIILNQLRQFIRRLGTS
ncbi:transcription termination/antitermination NusG family protein [Paenibacillus sp. WLX2291]|uniref:transcription termination/antitermination NusG family protein n=1 Tax=Paenibacillus sp. WLX2291 TaxID=3296934 RepID=UPI0039845DF6